MKKIFSPAHLLPVVHDWMHRHPRRTAIFAASGLLLASSLIVFASLYRKPVAIEPAPTQKKVVKAPEKKYYSPLTGVQVTDEAATKQAVTAIMIENSPSARPQSGIKEAGIVYEAIAEGGITRFLALYQTEKPQLIGPVRSVRLYYVDWLAPYQASVAHIGGSKFALDEVRNGSYRDIDQFFNSPYYWRATDRYAPHNVYTSFEKLDALNSMKGYNTSTFTSFTRTDGKPSTTPNATSVDLNFSSAWYDTHYDYDARTNTYQRGVGGEAHMDREKGQVAPSVVIAMKVDMTMVMEDGWREQITTSGTGSAVVFQNGTVIEATWRKNDRQSPLELIDANGAAISLNRGQTWIAAIPNGKGTVAWQ